MGKQMTFWKINGPFGKYMGGIVVTGQDVVPEVKVRVAQRGNL